MLCQPTNLEHQSVCMRLEKKSTFYALREWYLCTVQFSTFKVCWCLWPAVDLFNLITLFSSTALIFLVFQSFQTQWRSHSHQNSEHWWLLRPVWRREVRNSLGAGPVLHGKPGAAEGEEWRSHRTALPPQLCWSHHGKVSCCEHYSECWY